MGVLAEDEGDRYDTTSSSTTWRLSAEDVAAVRSAANAAGRLRAAGSGGSEGVEAPPRCLVGCEGGIPACYRRGAPAESGVSGEDEALFTRWFERQIQLLCGRAAPRESRLRRSDKVASTAVVLFKRFFLSQSVIECDPMTYALCAIFVASKLEDEFVGVGDLAAAVSEGKDSARVAALAEEVSRAEPVLLAGVRFDLRVAHPHRPLRALFDACAAAAAGDGADPAALEAARQAALDGCDALLATDAPLLYAPTVLAVAALARAAEAGGPVAPAALDGELRDLFDGALLNDAYALAKTIPEAQVDDADNANLKKVRKRLKKCALWRDAEKKPKRPRGGGDGDDPAAPAAGDDPPPPAKRAKAA